MVKINPNVAGKLEILLRSIPLETISQKNQQLNQMLPADKKFSN